MNSQVFYRKWRPQTLAEVVGQEPVTRTLLNGLASGNISHAYLFCGPRGTGKTSTGRILAKSVNCLSNQGQGEPCNTCTMCQAITEARALDVIEVDAASNRRIDEIRDLREKVKYSPNEARYKVYLIDEVHMLTTEASNALLKTLEEPPPHAIFILATTEAHKILPTIMSRCQRFDFRRLSRADVVQKLALISRAENISAEDEVLQLIARAASGSLRDAENLLQQLSTYYGDDIQVAQVREMLGMSGDVRAWALVKHVLEGNIPSAINLVNEADNEGADLRQFARDVVDSLRALLLVKAGSEESLEITSESREEFLALAGQVSLDRIMKCARTFGMLEMERNSYSPLPLELAIVECAQADDARIEDRPSEKPVLKAATPMPPAATTSQPSPVRETASAPEKTEPVPEPQNVAEGIETEQEPHIPVPEAVPADEPQDLAPTVPQAMTEGTNDIEVSGNESDPAETKDEIPEVLTVPVTEAETPSSEIDLLLRNWRQYIQQAPEGIGRTPAAALLRTARPKNIEGDTVVVSFKFTLHKDNMEKLENRKIAERIVSHALGRQCRVECIFEPEKNHLVRAAQKYGEIVHTEEK